VTKDIARTVKIFFETYPLQTFGKGDKLVQTEEPITSVFYIIKGLVRQSDLTPGGNAVVVNIFKPQAFFPMSSAMNGTPNHYFFEAGTKVVVRVAPAKDAVTFIKTNPDVMFDLLSRVYRGMDGVLRRTAHLMWGDVKSRLIFELLNAAARFGKPQADGSIFINLSEGNLAKHSGLARETVSRNIQSLKAMALVEIKPGGILLKKPDQLAEMLGNDI
jgi:CRP-like cAMP-binding protein